MFYTRSEDKLRVSVFNTGQPIPEEDIEKIWVKFYKVDKARTREYGVIMPVPVLLMSTSRE